MGVCVWHCIDIYFVPCRPLALVHTTFRSLWSDLCFIGPRYLEDPETIFVEVVSIAASIRESHPGGDAKWAGFG